MNILEKLKNILSSFFKKDDVKLLEAPEKELIIQSNPKNRMDFIESIKINISTKKAKKQIVQFPICPGDGLGINTDLKV